MKKCKGVPKNAELYADFISVGKIEKNAYNKSYEQNSQLKVHYSAFNNTLF